MNGLLEELVVVFFFLRIRRPPRSTLFPYRRSSDLVDLCPSRAVVLRHMQLSVIRASIEQALLQCGFGDVGDCSEGNVSLPFRARIRRQVGAYACPLVAPVLALEKHVGAGIERLGVVMRQDEGSHPVESQSFSVRCRAGPDAASLRSEERRVGKECRSRWSPYH